MKQILKYILAQVMESLKIAENKHGLILALNSGLVVITIGFFSSSIKIIVVLNWLVILFACLSIFCCFLGLFSRSIKIDLKIKNKNDVSLLYYKDLMNFTPEGLLKCIIINYNLPKDYNYDGFEYDLSKQIIANSKVAYNKYIFFNFSLIFLSIALTLDLILMALVGVIS